MVYCLGETNKKGNTRTGKQNGYRESIDARRKKQRIQLRPSSMGGESREPWHSQGYKQK